MVEGEVMLAVDKLFRCRRKKSNSPCGRCSYEGKVSVPQAPKVYWRSRHNLKEVWETEE